MCVFAKKTQFKLQRIIMLRTLLLLQLLLLSVSLTHSLIHFTHPLNATTLTSRWLRFTMDRDTVSTIASSVWSYPDISICLTVIRHAFFFARNHPEERTSQCFPLSSDAIQNNYPLLTTHEVELKIKGKYSAHARLITGYSSQENILYNISTQFRYAVSEDCKHRLQKVQHVVKAIKHEQNNNAGGAYDPMELSDPFNDVSLNPICLNENTAFKSLGDFLSTASGFRGTFGVDSSAQEFGHGDNMMLHYIMSKYRNSIRNGILVEMGCFAGVTSLTLGIAASLRDVDFHAFDIVDMRPPNVKRTWLPNMYHHLLDLDACLTEKCPLLEKYLPNTSFLMVDANHATRLESALHFGQMLREDAVIVVHDFPAYRTIDEWKEQMGNIGYELVDEMMRSQIFVSTLATFIRT